MNNFKDHYGDVFITQCLVKIAEINEFSASSSYCITDSLTHSLTNTQTDFMMFNAANC